MKRLLFFVLIALGVCHTNAQITTSEVNVEVTNDTTSIDGALEVSNDSDIISKFHSSLGSNSRIEIHNALGNVNLGIGSQPSTNGYSYLWGSGGNFMIGSDGSPSLVVKGMSQGKIGIGTTDPTRTLEIVEDGTEHAEIILRQTNSTVNWGLSIRKNTNGLGLIENSGEDLSITGGWGSTLTLGHQNFNTYGGKVIIPGGNVGIGVNTPQAKLHVNGTIKAPATDWSDFVFYDDYELASLEEVEKHIEEFGHLKDVPSEAEVKKDDVDLTQMDARLLQKIEELTLYVIDLNKRVKELEAENQALKSEE